MKKHTRINKPETSKKLLTRKRRDYSENKETEDEKKKGEKEACFRGGDQRFRLSRISGGGGGGWFSVAVRFKELEKMEKHSSFEFYETFGEKRSLNSSS